MSDDEDLELGHNPDTYEPARLGVPVWEYLTASGRCVYFSRPDVGQSERITPGLWFATTPENRMAMQEKIAEAVIEWTTDVSEEHVVMGVMRALGFQDGE